MIVVSAGTVASLALAAPATSPALATTAAPVVLPVTTLASSVAQAPLAPRPFGQIGFVGVVKPVVKRVVRPRRVVAPEAVSRLASAVSRSSRRTPVSTRSTSRHTSPVAASTSGNGRLLDVAASLAGIYYVYGGTTPAGFDCSGYTQYVFRKVGIRLPRTAEAQRQAATPVSNPRPGDLVFFGSPAHHVGIYAGNGKMWDSEQTGTAVQLHTDRSERGGGATYGRI